MARGSGVGKTVVLLFLIAILCLGGLLWFDYLGIVHAKKIFSPIYRLLGMQAQTSSIVSEPRLASDIDQDRIDKQRESLALYKEELDKRDADATEAEKKNEQIASELADREKSQEEREKTFNKTVKRYDDKNANIERIANNLNGMQPAAAVDILVAMDDQIVIDVLRKVEEIAASGGTASMGAYWLSLMPADRAAEIQRKMIAKPESLD